MTYIPVGNSGDYTASEILTGPVVPPRITLASLEAANQHLRVQTEDPPARLVIAINKVLLPPRWILRLTALNAMNREFGLTRDDYERAVKSLCRQNGLEEIYNEVQFTVPLRTGPGEITGVELTNPCTEFYLRLMAEGAEELNRFAPQALANLGFSTAEANAWMTAAKTAATTLRFGIDENLAKAAGDFAPQAGEIVYNVTRRILEDGLQHIRVLIAKRDVPAGSGKAPVESGDSLLSDTSKTQPIDAEVVRSITTIVGNAVRDALPRHLVDHYQANPANQSSEADLAIAAIAELELASKKVTTAAVARHICPHDAENARIRLTRSKRFQDALDRLQRNSPRRGSKTKDGIIEAVDEEE